MEVTRHVAPPRKLFSARISAGSFFLVVAGEQKPAADGFHSRSLRESVADAEDIDRTGIPYAHLLFPQDCHSPDSSGILETPLLYGDHLEIDPDENG